jgi:hypothetical protein
MNTTRFRKLAGHVDAPLVLRADETCMFSRQKSVPDWLDKIRKEMEEPAPQQTTSDSKDCRFYPGYFDVPTVTPQT